MFEALKTEGTLESLTLMNGNGISQETLDFFIDNLVDVPGTRVARIQRNQTKREISALITAIEAHGMTASLLAFANHDGSLGTVIRSIPSVYSLTSEKLSSSKTAQIVTDLKSLNLDIATESAAEFIVPIVGGFIQLIGQVITSILAYKGWRAWRDDKKNRIGYVIPFNVLTTYLEEAQKAPEILESLNTLTLPTTEEESTQFYHKVESILNQLKDLGIHVSGEDVTVSPLPDIVKVSIEHVGYGESALSDIVSHAERMKSTLSSLKSLSTRAYISQLNAITDKEEKTHAQHAFSLINDINHTVLTRVTKIIKLTNKVINGIKGFYKKA